MSHLHIEIERLRHFLRPWHTGRGPVVWEPEASDSNAKAKRNIVGVAADTIAAGKLAIKGDSFSIPVFDESDYEALEESFTEDHERERFLALAQACQLALHELRRFVPERFVQADAASRRDLTYVSGAIGPAWC